MQLAGRKSVDVEKGVLGVIEGFILEMIKDEVWAGAASKVLNEMGGMV